MKSLEFNRELADLKSKIKQKNIFHYVILEELRKNKTSFGDQIGLLCIKYTEDTHLINT